MGDLYKQIGIDYFEIIYKMDCIRFFSVVQQVMININGTKYTLPAKTWYGRE